MKNNTRNIALLFLTLVIVMIGFGMIIPILPYYIEHFGAGGSTLGLLMATYGVMQFVFAPIWGQLSDRFGRKPILVLGIAGNTLANLIFGLSTSLWMLFAARALAGMLSSATLPTAMAYISDNTTGENRSGGMGILGAAMGLGMVIGPGLGGWMGSISLAAPFFLAASLGLLSLILVLMLLPESLPPAARTAATGKIRGARLSAIGKGLTGPLGFLFFMAFLLSFGLTCFESVFGLYALKRFGYDSARIGTILMIVGSVSAIVQGGLTGPLTRRWGEERIIRGSLLATAAGFLIVLTAHSFASVVITVAFFMTSNAMLTPSVTALISKRTASGQGTTLGLNNSFQSLGRIIGPTWAGLLLDAGLNYPFISGAVIMLAGFVVSLSALKQDETGARA